jgi:hypothetical protein
LYRRLGGPQSRSGHGDEEKNSQPLPGIEPLNPDRPARSPVGRVFDNALENLDFYPEDGGSKFLVILILLRGIRTHKLRIQTFTIVTASAISMHEADNKHLCSYVCTLACEIDSRLLKLFGFYNELLHLPEHRYMCYK